MRNLVKYVGIGLLVVGLQPVITATRKRLLRAHPQKAMRPASR